MADDDDDDADAAAEKEAVASLDDARAALESVLALLLARLAPGKKLLTDESDSAMCEHERGEERAAEGALLDHGAFQRLRNANGHAARDLTVRSQARNTSVQTIPQSEAGSKIRRPQEDAGKTTRKVGKVHPKSHEQQSKHAPHLLSSHR